MLRIVINEVEQNFDSSAAHNLNELYNSLLSEFKKPELFVSSIKLNGETLSEKEIINKRELPISEVESLELIILTLPEIALNNINNAMEYLDKLISGVEKASELFRTKSEEEANKHFILCVEGLSWFGEVIENIRITLEPELNKTEYDKDNIKNLLEKLLSLTKELSDSQSKKDWVMLADLLEYELSPYLDEWKSILPLFVQAAQSKIKYSPM